MRKLVSKCKLGLTIYFISLSLFGINCGVGNGGDVGASAIVTASLDKSLIDGDIVHIEDTNNDGICGNTGDSITTPPEENVTVNLNIEQVSPNIKLSPVHIYEVSIRYEPADANSPQFPASEPNPWIYPVSFTFSQNDTFSIPIIRKEVKKYFYLNNLTGNYNVYITLKMKEVYYDKNMEIKLGTYLTLSNRIQQNECTP